MSEGRFICHFASLLFEVGRPIYHTIFTIICVFVMYVLWVLMTSNTFWLRIKLSMDDIWINERYFCLIKLMFVVRLYQYVLNISTNIIVVIRVISLVIFVTSAYCKSNIPYINYVYARLIQISSFLGSHFGNSRQQNIRIFVYSWVDAQIQVMNVHRLISIWNLR